MYIVTIAVFPALEERLLTDKFGVVRPRHIVVEPAHRGSYLGNPPLLEQVTDTSGFKENRIFQRRFSRLISKLPRIRIIVVLTFLCILSEDFLPL